MTVLEVTSVAIAIATGLTACAGVYWWWCGRKVATIRFYRVLKDSLEDDDPNHWVKLVLPTTLPPNWGAGKVVALTRTTVTLDHPQVGNQPLPHEVVYSVQRLHRREEHWPGWEPDLDPGRTSK